MVSHVFFKQNWPEVSTLRCWMALLSVFVMSTAWGDNPVPVDTLREKPKFPREWFYTIEAGSSSLTDTYLSPLTFRGWSMGMGFERMSAMGFNPQRWGMDYGVGLSAQRATPQSLSVAMWGARLKAWWGMLHKWDFGLENLSVAFGPSAGIDAGVLYIDRSGNNPASAKGAVTLNVDGLVKYGWHIGRFPVDVSCHPTMALAGVFFSPEYDELYYEIYLGNRKGLVHAAWPWKRFALSNLMAVDLKFRSITLRIGYRLEMMSSKVSHLTTNMFTHQFVLGFSAPMGIGNLR